MLTLRPLSDVLSHTAPHQIIRLGTEFCPLWRDPQPAVLAPLLTDAVTGPSLAGLRALVSKHHLILWQSTAVLHQHAERLAGLGGLRVQPRCGLVLIHEEAAVSADHLPWIREANAPDVDPATRREIVTRWLAEESPLRALYGGRFRTKWYM